MSHDNAAQPPADQEIDARMLVVQEAVSALANPIPILEDTEAELDILADEGADPEALNAIHNNAITLLDSQQRLATVFISVSNGRAHVARVTSGREVWASNWEALEDDALTEVEAQSGYATLSALYACSPGLAQQATWG